MSATWMTCATLVDAVQAEHVLPSCSFHRGFEQTRAVASIAAFSSKLNEVKDSLQFGKAPSRCGPRVAAEPMHFVGA